MDSATNMTEGFDVILDTGFTCVLSCNDSNTGGIYHTVAAGVYSKEFVAENVP